MKYTYSEKYGVDNGKGKRKKDEFGNDIPWQREFDGKVDKGLMQVAKEDRLPFAQLIAVIQRETVRDMHSEDRWRVPAYMRLDAFQGPCYACSDGTTRVDALRYYWYDQLGVERV